MTTAIDRTETPFRRTLVHVARDLLSYTPGDRVPTSEAYTERLGVGVGTVVKAVKVLTESGAIQLESHGFRGTVLTSRDIGALWRAAELAPLRVAFSPPGARDHFGLAIGCLEESRRIGVAATPMLAASAAERAEWVRSGVANVAVMSTSAAHVLAARGGSLDVVELAPVVYYGREQLVLVARPGADELASPRVGVDRRSPDHAALSDEAFVALAGARLVDCPFRDIPAAILRDEIDLGVWHRMDAPISPEMAGLVVRPWETSLNRPQVNAAILVRTLDNLTRVVVEAFEPKRISSTQGDVMASKNLDAVQTRLWTAGTP